MPNAQATSTTGPAGLTPEAWDTVTLQHPAAKTALETARLLAAYTQMMVEDDQHFHAGDQVTRIPPDLGVESIRRQVNQWPPGSLDHTATASRWPTGIGALYQAERSLQWVNEPGRRLWPTVLTLTKTAARLESEAQAYYQGVRETLPDDPPGLSADWPDQIVQALGSLPEQVHEIREMEPPPSKDYDPEAFDPDAPDFTEKHPWHLGLIDSDHLVAWRMVDGQPEWWTNSQGEASVWVRPDQAIRALRETHTPFIGGNGGAVTLAPESVQHAWRTNRVQGWVHAAKALATDWRLQAVNHTQAVAYRVTPGADPDAPAELLLNPEHPFQAPKLFPLADAENPEVRAQWADEWDLRWAPTPVEKKLTPAVKNAVDAAIVRVKAAQDLAAATPAAPEPVEPTAPDRPPHPPWQIGRVDLGQVVAWRETPAGAVEWWSPEADQMPFFPTGTALQTALVAAGEPVVPMTEESTVLPVPDRIRTLWRAQSVDRLIQFTRTIPEPAVEPVSPPTVPGAWRAQALDTQRVIVYHSTEGAAEATILTEPDHPERILTLTRDRLKNAIAFEETGRTLGITWESPTIQPATERPQSLDRALAAHTWTVQAVNRTLAIAYQPQADGSVHVLRQRQHPDTPEWIDRAKFQAPGGATELSRVLGIQWADGTIREPAVMPESVQQAISAAVLHPPSTPTPTTPRSKATAPSDSTPWQLQKLNDETFVCYRWDAQGRPEGFHAPEDPAPPQLLVWSARYTQQWLADPAHAAQVQQAFDPVTTPVAVKAQLAMTPKGPAAPAFALPKF